MISKQVLAKFGSTNDKIREVFTAEDPNTDNFKARKRFEEKLSGRLTTGLEFSMSNSYLSSVADLAWDAAPILKQNIPLILFAQGKIKFDECRKELDKLGCASEFIKEKDGKAYVDLPRFYEVAVNLVRSYLTRRVAAQASRVMALYPHFKYEARATDQVGKLRADALSQRIEIMTDQYGYRHLITQIIRNMFLYGHTLAFPQCSWDREVQYRMSSQAEDATPESYVRREGVPFILPHPSRIFWDRSQPLATLNFDTGCEYVGFWDIVKFKDIERNPAYFNRRRIRITETGRNISGRFGLFLETQFNAQRISFPATQGTDPSLANDQRQAYSFYSQATADESLFLSEYFEKVIPAEVGLGDYPSPVWLRLVVAADDSVIYGEFMPSLPAVYFGYNANDSRLLNLAPSHEIMPWQDQVSNLLSQLLLTAKASAMKIVSLDIDAFEDDELRQAVKRTLQAKDYYVHPILIEYSGNKMRALGVNAESPLRMQELEMSNDITQYFRSITQLLAIVERLLTLSPQELGQAAPREISATEASEIASSTNTVYNFIADSVDEGRATWKRLLYEALVSCASTKIEVPVVNQYSNDVIRRAGFTISGAEVPQANTSDDLTLVGSPQALVHEYVFTSRDGDDRPSNQQAASTLIQLSQALLTNPAVMQSVGKRKLFEIFNEIFRKSGAGVDLKLEVPEGEPDQFGPDPAQLEQLLGQLQQQLQQISQQSGQAEQTAASAEQTAASAEQTASKNANELAAASAQIEQLMELLTSALQQPAAPAPAVRDILGSQFNPIGN